MTQLVDETLRHGAGRDGYTILLSEHPPAGPGQVMVEVEHEDYTQADAPRDKSHASNAWTRCHYGYRVVTLKASRWERMQAWFSPRSITSHDRVDAAADQVIAEIERMRSTYKDSQRELASIAQLMVRISPPVPDPSEDPGITFGRNAS